MKGGIEKSFLPGRAKSDQLNKEDLRAVEASDMTREEILAMSGTDLDAQIAKLLGKKVYQDKHGRWRVGTAFRSLDKTPPHYSRDISDAWPVVDKMFELGYAMSLLHLSSEFYPEYWYCDFRPKDSNKPPEYEWVDHQMTAPVAISKAALIARLDEIKRLEGKEDVLQ